MRAVRNDGGAGANFLQMVPKGGAAGGEKRSPRSSGYGEGKESSITNEARKNGMVMERLIRYPPQSLQGYDWKCLTLPPESFWAWRR